MEPIRWLHLSDFHFGKDALAIEETCLSLLDHVKERMKSGPLPDFLFLTGDLANAGKTTEFEQFNKTFLLPLQTAISIDHTQRTFIVPGNHDVNRDEAKAAANYNMVEQCREFFDSTSDGQKQRIPLYPRFSAFADFDVFDRTKWILSEEGYSTQVIDIRGCKVGILLLNTSWLSKGDRDKEQLRVGVETIKQALRRIKDCEVRMVVGHHPLHWLHGDEASKVARLFAKSDVMYFHGHLHKNESYRRFSFGGEYFGSQVGCVFQARDDQKWRNGFGWGALDVERRTVEIEPMKWSPDLEEWVLDTDLLPNTFRVDGKYVIPLSNKQSATTVKVSAWDPPSGWHHLSQDYFYSQARRLSEADKLRYFDGRVPEWADILDGYIPERGINSDLLNDIKQTLTSSSNGLLLIKGPGGEGKSTVLRQVALAAAKKFGDQVEVLWHSNHNLGLPTGWMPPRVEEKKIIIVSDEGNAIVPDLMSLMTRLQVADRKDVVFLIAARDTDWIAASGGSHPWRKYSDFKEYAISGVDDDDAELIVGAWAALGKAGLGHLDGLALPEAVKALVAASQSESARGEGALLGAMLRTRIGEELHSYVRLLLERLAEVKCPGGSLLDAFAYMAFPHADNILCLSKVLLAELLRCKEKEIRPLVMMPLGEEAAASISGDLILTRHRAIAEVAVTILCDEYGFDKETVLGDMVETAVRMRWMGNVPYFKRWVYLAEMYETTDPQLALQLALRAHKGDPADQFYATKASKLLRANGRGDEALDLFSGYAPEANTLRGYFLEWGVVLRDNDKSAQATYLMSVSLLDGIEDVYANSRQVEYTFVNLIEPLLTVYNQDLDPAYRNTATMIFSLIMHDSGISTTTKQRLEALSERFGLQQIELTRVDMNAVLDGLVKTNEYEVLLRDGVLPEVQKGKLTSIIKYREYVQRSLGAVRK
jgi:hypothetical protein